MSSPKAVTIYVLLVSLFFTSVGITILPFIAFLYATNVAVPSLFSLNIQSSFVANVYSPFSINSTSPSSFTVAIIFPSIIK